MAAGVPYSFAAGEVIASAQVNANFAALVSYFNGLNIPTTPVTVNNGGTGANNAQGALQSLGLAVGTIIPCTASISGQTIQITGASFSPAVQTYQNGTTYVFVVPAAMSGASSPILIQDTTTALSGLSALALYDSPGLTNTQALLAEQLVIAAYSSAVAGFVLVNTPPIIANNAARFAFFSTTGGGGTGVSGSTWTCPTGITQVWATACGGGGGGGSGGLAVSGGGGGGGAAAYKKQPLVVVPGVVYTMSVGAGGTAGSSSAGGTGGTTQMVNSSAATIFSCSGGTGGAMGAGTSPISGGAPGGAGGLAGQSGYFVTGDSLGFGGAGGGCLLGAGAATQGGFGNGATPGEFGGGGAGGTGGGTGGAGAPGYILLEW